MSVDTKQTRPDTATAGPGRHRGRIGLAVLLVGVVAFVVLQFIAG